MHRPSLNVIIIAIISTTFTICIALLLGAQEGLNSIMSAAQISDNGNESNRKVVGSHTPGYPIATSSGSVLDPLQTSASENPANMVVEPMKYVREFEYGKASKLPDGGTLREFTLVPSDDLVKEISPGVFYNVWTFNGSDHSGYRRRQSEHKVYQ